MHLIQRVIRLFNLIQKRLLFEMLLLRDRTARSLVRFASQMQVKSVRVGDVLKLSPVAMMCIDLVALVGRASDRQTKVSSLITSSVKQTCQQTCQKT